MAARLKKDPDLVVGKLVRLWCWADQNAISGEKMSVTRSWIDRYVGQKKFADAMEFVGWLEGDDLALSFTNFSRHNGDSAKKRASEQRRKNDQRARQKEGSERDKCPAEGGTKKGPQRGPEEEIEYSNNNRAQLAQKIVGLYPRREKLADALEVVEQHLADGFDEEAMMSGTKAAAAVIRTLPSGKDNIYVPSALAFFRGKRWQDDPETLKRQGSRESGQGKLNLDDAKKQLGGRAAYLEP